VRTIAAILCAAATQTIPAAEAVPADAVTRWNVGAWTVWRIDRPGSRTPREYPEIRLQPGDRVLVDAGGCAAGSLVSIPGATDGAVRVRAILRRELHVPRTLPEAASLVLGGGCEDGRDGWVMVGAQHPSENEPLPLPRPMDLVSNGSVDANGIPLNPRWGLQETQPGALPNPVELCFDVPGWFDNPICTVQRPSVDEPVGLKRAICSIGVTTPIKGHVNWFAATYQGPLFWLGKFFSDQDVNISLVPPEQRGLTTADPEAILTEFDARETLNHFSTPWWKELRRAASLGAKARGRELVDARPAIVTGLAGLDCEHDCYTELHPVWMLALRAEAETPHETWAVFARNWGNEGFCSSQQHYLETVAHRVTVTLPWRDGASGVRLGRQTRFYANVEGVRAWWSAAAGHHVSVTFELPAPEARGRVHGEIRLNWSGPAAPPAAVASGAPPVHERGEGPEPLVEDLIAGMTPRQRRALERREPAAVTADLVPVVLQRGPPPSASAPRLFAPSVRSVPDPGRDVEDLRRLEALTEAYGGPLPGSLRDLPRLLEPR
jgi:hypothetical protein